MAEGYLRRSFFWVMAGRYIFKKPGLVFFPDDDYPGRINSKK